MSNLASAARSRLPRLAEAATSRARLVLVPARASGARRTPFVVLVLALLAVGMVGLLLFNTLMQQDAFRATALQQRADRLLAEQQSLSMTVSDLRDPQRLALRARALGMVNPPNPAFLRLSDGKILGVPTVATVADGVHVRRFPAAKPRDLAPPPRVVHVVEQPAKQRKTDRTDRSSGADRADHSHRADHGDRARQKHDAGRQDTRKPKRR